MKFDKEAYASEQIASAKLKLERSPDDISQKDRICYWYAYLGDFKNAEEWAFTDKARDYIREFNGR